MEDHDISAEGAGGPPSLGAEQEERTSSVDIPPTRTEHEQRTEEGEEEEEYGTEPLEGSTVSDEEGETNMPAGGPPPPPPGGPPPLPDWLQRSIAGVPPPLRPAVDGSAPPAPPAATAPTAAGPADLAAMLSQRQLRATVVVEKQVVETPQDELRRALTRRMSNKATAKKDEIIALVAKLRDGQFGSFDELARVVHHATRVQNEVGNIELIKMAHWPLDLLNSLREVVGIIQNIRGNMKRTEDALRDQANKGLAINEQAVANIRDCVRVLRETPNGLDRAEKVLGMLTVSVPLHAEAALAKARALIESCVKVVFELALAKYKQPIPRNSFNLRYRLTHTINLLETAITLSHEAGVRDKRQEADQAILDMQARYADVLNIRATSTGDASVVEGSQPPPPLPTSSTPVARPSMLPPTLSRSGSLSLRASGSSSSSSSRSALHGLIADGLGQKLAAYVANLCGGDKCDEDLIVAELAQEDNRARTPLEVAILLADERAVQALLSLCTPSTPGVTAFLAAYRNGEGNTYAHMAASLPRATAGGTAGSPTTILAALIAALGPALLSHLNDRNETPLHSAAKVGNAETAKYLVEQGVPLGAKDKFGRDALSLLALKCIKHVEVAPPPTALAGGAGAARGPGLFQYFLSEALSDVHFDVRGTRYPAHRIVLCAQSPSFKSMLENKEWKEAQGGEVHVEDVSPAAFKHLLEHLYSSGESAFSTSDLELALDLLYAADRFLIDGLKLKCEHVLYRMMTLENAFLLYTRASRHSAQQLREAAAHMILTHYDEIGFADEDHGVLFDILHLCGASGSSTTVRDSL